MGGLLQSAGVQLIVGVVILAMLVLVGIYVIGRFRGEYAQQGPTASELLTDFRELHSQGELSDEEFRTIKSMLSEKLAAEVKRTADDG